MRGDDLCAMFRCFLLDFWGGPMRPGQAHAARYTMRCLTKRLGLSRTGLLVTSLGSIVRDSRAPHAPNLDERRQKEHADSGSAKIPCFQVPDSTQHFPFWIQSVAAGCRNRARQMKTVHSRTKKVEGGWQRCILFPHPSSTAISLKNSIVRRLARHTPR